MPKIIDILLDEHQNIEKLLLVLEHELEVFDRSGRRFSLRFERRHGLYA